MRTIIIDDERLAREELKKLLKDYHEIEIIDEAKNPEEGIEKIKALKPDLIFLDIQMPGMTGFDMLKKLDEIPQVVFVTAFDDFALKAFEVNALDYVLKPVDPARLDETVKKLLNNPEADFQSTAKAPKIDRSSRPLTISDSIFIKDGEKCFFISLDKVRIFESDGNYVKVYFEKSRPLILRSLNSLEERLEPQHFFRANRKYIINLNWVQKVENWFNGGLQVELKPVIIKTSTGEEIREGEKIEISRRQAIKFKELFSI
ncbi:response regulator [Fluviicola sp.]|uniref:LytR/AlgR family response regulator transcription factor n=1 Tax=Fluviicola sp. TaxID=1917219 RepID=UPI0031DD109E